MRSPVSAAPRRARRPRRPAAPPARAWRITRRCRYRRRGAWGLGFRLPGGIGGAGRVRDSGRPRRPRGLADSGEDDMRFLLMLVLVASSAFVARGAEKEKGFTPLFDGKS